MAENTGISWTTHSWNPTRGCKIVSPGCSNCYAMNLADRIPGYEGLTQRTAKGHVTWNGEVKLVEARLNEPLKWERKAVKTGETPRVFVDSMSDLWYEKIPDSYVDQVFRVMEACPHVTFQILTKRPERMRDYCQRREDLERDTRFEWEPEGLVAPNIWLGTSVEDQTRAHERIPFLLETPAAVRFLSCEPLLGPVSLERYLWKGDDWNATWDRRQLIHWIIVGGESGPGFRPMDLDWARSLRDQCRAAGVPFFFKQGSGLRPGKGTFLDGREWHEFPDAALLRDAVEAK